MEEIKGTSKMKAVKERIRSLAEDNTTLRVIAEKICTYRYYELSDEFKSLKLVIRTLKGEGYEWSRKQIRTAIKYCYDPRYYTREDLRDIYKLANIDIKQLPTVPKEWKGVSEWVTTKSGWERIREGSEDLPKEKVGFLRGREE